MKKIPKKKNNTQKEANAKTFPGADFRMRVVEFVTEP